MLCIFVFNAVNILENSCNCRKIVTSGGFLKICYAKSTAPSAMTESDLVTHKPELHFTYASFDRTSHTYIDFEQSISAKFLCWPAIMLCSWSHSFCASATWVTLLESPCKTAHVVGMTYFGHCYLPISSQKSVLLLVSHPFCKKMNLCQETFLNKSR